MSARMPETGTRKRASNTSKKARPRKRNTAKPSPNTANWRSQPPAVRAVMPEDMKPASKSPIRQARKKTLVLKTERRIPFNERRNSNKMPTTISA